MYRESIVKPAQIFLFKRSLLFQPEGLQESDQLIFYLPESRPRIRICVLLESKMLFFIRQHLEGIQQFENVYLTQSRRPLHLQMDR